jgi:hypothetical protein
MRGRLIAWTGRPFDDEPRPDACQVVESWLSAGATSALSPRQRSSTGEATERGGAAEPEPAFERPADTSGRRKRVAGIRLSRFCTLPVLATPSRAPNNGQEDSVHRAHRVVCYIVLALSILQFLWIGLAILGGAEEPGFPLHVLGGYLITLLALVAVVLAAIGRREALGWSAGLFGVLVLQIVLVEVSRMVPIVGALHPVNALVVLFVASAAARGGSMSQGAGGGGRAGAAAAR